MMHALWLRWWPDRQAGHTERCVYVFISLSCFSFLGCPDKLMDTSPAAPPTSTSTHSLTGNRGENMQSAFASRHPVKWDVMLEDYHDSLTGAKANSGRIKWERNKIKKKLGSPHQSFVILFWICFSFPGKHLRRSIWNQIQSQGL